MTITQKITALISAANAKTGETDTTLTSAIGHLIDGGQGGSRDEAEMVTIPSTKALYLKADIDDYLSLLVSDFSSVLAIVTTSIDTYVADRCCCYFTNSMIAGGSIGFTMENATTYRIRAYGTTNNACKFVEGDTYVVVRKPTLPLLLGSPNGGTEENEKGENADV